MARVDTVDVEGGVEVSTVFSLFGLFISCAFITLEYFLIDL